MPLTIVAQMTAKDGKAGALHEALTGLVGPTLSEVGCEIYELHRSVEDPNLFHFHEVWTTREDWEAHGQSAHINAFRAMGAELLADRKIFQLERIA